MHSSATKIRKPKRHPIPRMKRAAPKKAPEPAEAFHKRDRRRRQFGRILPGIPYWCRVREKRAFNEHTGRWEYHSIDDPFDAGNGFRIHHVNLNWVSNKIEAMRTGVSPHRRGKALYAAWKAVGNHPAFPWHTWQVGDVWTPPAAP